jgi:hypothetical protein
MELKTNRQNIQDIPDKNIRHNALHNMYIHMRIFNSMERIALYEDTLYSAFLWDKTEECWDYWKQINDFYFEKKSGSSEFPDLTSRKVVPVLKI